MVVICHVCREVVHTSSGVILQHGTNYHGKFNICAGSLTQSYAGTQSKTLSKILRARDQRACAHVSKLR